MPPQVVADKGLSYIPTNALLDFVGSRLAETFQSIRTPYVVDERLVAKDKLDLDNLRKQNASDFHDLSLKMDDMASIIVSRISELNGDLLP